MRKTKLDGGRDHKGDNNMSTQKTQAGDPQKMSVNHSNLTGDNNMSNTTKQVGDLHELSVNHSELTGDNMSVKNELNYRRNRKVNYSINYSNTSIFELETDLSGQVKDTHNLIQIKLWERKDQGLILKGTMTFHFYEDPFTYSGILNKRNSEMFLRLWIEIGITEYVVEKIDNEYFVDVLWAKYMFTDYRNYYLELVKEFPEYRNLKLIG
jgi:hypothetical protein